MCNVMITDKDKLTMQWLAGRVKSSGIRTEELIICDPDDALAFMKKHDVDIVLAKIDTASAAGLDFARSIKRRRLLTKIMGYGSRGDSGFLLKAMSNGISYYSCDIYNTREITAVLNKAYGQYRRQRMEVSLKAEEEKERSAKTYTSSILHEWSEDFFREAASGNYRDMESYYDYLFEIMDKQSFLSSKRMIIELLVIVADRMEKAGINLPVLPVKEKDYHMIIGMKNCDGLKEWFKKSMKSIARITKEILKADSNSHKLALTLEYINGNFHRDISRDEVAGRMHLNPCYFSQFFKQQMGESFVEYLRRIRMERARHLLEYGAENLTEVAAKVGYNDGKYFARVLSSDPTPSSTTATTPPSQANGSGLILSATLNI